MTTNLKLCRDEMVRMGVDALLIPRADAFQGEEVPKSEDRLNFISGFTGSAGSAVVTKDQAALFSDGRYTLQMARQVGGDWECFTTPDVKMTDWIKTNIAANAVLGVDPWLTTLGQWRRLKTSFADTGITLSMLDHNPIDAIWADRPAPPQAPAWDYAEEYAGQTRRDKVNIVLEHMANHDAGGMLITGADQLNWLLNIRGNDLEYSPLFLAFGLVNNDGTVDVFTDQSRIANIIQTGINAIMPPLDGMIASRSKGGILIDAMACPLALAEMLAGRTIERPSIITTLKARKNAVEIAGIRNAHRRDAAAMVRFLAWFDANVGGGIREVQVAEKLLQLRGAEKGFISTSFATICGTGENGAIVHYRAEDGKDKAIMPNTLCLIDSGGHFLDATTDITRTVAVGAVSAQMQHDFTHVLKAHIALAVAVFPEGTTGIQLDAITRAPLWAVGMDYAHGTGHGVGCCLNVHEAPQSISKQGKVVIEAGMVVSNEPGHYIEGEYGIRIENLMIAQHCSKIEGYLHFENVTLVPIDKRLIDVGFLTSVERAWVNDYHAKVAKTIAPMLAGVDDDGVNVKAWFDDATAPI